MNRYGLVVQCIPQVPINPDLPESQWQFVQISSSVLGDPFTWTPWRKYRGLRLNMIGRTKAMVCRTPDELKFFLESETGMPHVPYALEKKQDEAPQFKLGSKRADRGNFDWVNQDEREKNEATAD